MAIDPHPRVEAREPWSSCDGAFQVGGTQGHPVCPALRQAETSPEPPYGPNEMKPDHDRLGVDRSDADAALTQFARDSCRVAQTFKLRAIRLITERDNAPARGTNMLREAEECELAKSPDGASINHSLDRVRRILDQ